MTSGPASTSPSSITPLRRDAARNRDKLLAAARVSFDEVGVDVGVEEIAQRAGVGVATLYRRFPTKDALIQAVVDEVLLEVLEAGKSALADEEPSNGLMRYIDAVGWIQYEHAGCLARLWNSPNVGRRAEIEVVARKLLSRAQSAGAVRRDLVYEDITMLFLSMRGVIEASADVAPMAWRRHLELLICSLSPSNSTLRHPPLSAQKMRAIAGTP